MISNFQVARLEKLVELLHGLLDGQPAVLPVHDAYFSKCFSQQISDLSSSDALVEDPKMLIGKDARVFGQFKRLPVTYRVQGRLRALENAIPNAYIAGASAAMRFQKKASDKAAGPMVLGSGDIQSAYEFFQELLTRTQNPDASSVPLVWMNEKGYWRGFKKLLGNDFPYQECGVKIVRKTRDVRKALSDYKGFEKPETSLANPKLLCLVTDSQDKVKTIQKVCYLYDADLSVVSLKDLLGDVPEVVEDKKTYIGNAEAKLEEGIKALQANPKLIKKICQRYDVAEEDFFLAGEDRGAVFADENIFQHRIFDPARSVLREGTKAHPGPEFKPAYQAMGGKKPFVSALKAVISDLKIKKGRGKVLRNSTLIMRSLKDGAPVMSFAGRRQAYFDAQSSKKKLDECMIDEKSHHDKNYAYDTLYCDRSVLGFLEYMKIPKQINRSSMKWPAIASVALSAVLLQGTPCAKTQKAPENTKEVTLSVPQKTFKFIKKTQER